MKVQNVPAGPATSDDVTYGNYYCYLFMLIKRFNLHCKYSIVKIYHFKYTTDKQNKGAQIQNSTV